MSAAEYPHWLPNFFIAGVPKAGTSSMHRWISDHPDAFGSREKETFFFSDPGTHMHRREAHISMGIDAWRDQFPVPIGHAPTVIVESTPANIYYQTALEQIPDLPSKPKCLFLLREPSEQIFSLYSYFRSNWDWISVDMSFGAFLTAVRNRSHDFKGNELAQNAISFGRYVDYLRLWRNRLGDERMLVLGFDALKADAVGLTKRVANWVGLDPSFYDSYAFPRENETYVPRSYTLQRANIAVRSHLPEGVVYRGLRSVYRKINTTKRNPIADADCFVLLRELRYEFAESNQVLADEFGVNFNK